MNDITDTREQILNAAMERIHHYGYGTTTMSEIARDCSMSAGNIYRFFASKIDIAEAMARKFNAKVFEDYAILARKKTSASSRLREFFEMSLERTFKRMRKSWKWPMCSSRNARSISMNRWRRNAFTWCRS